VSDKAREFVWKYSTHKGGARLVMLAIAEELQDSDTVELGLSILADYTGLDVRQIKRLLDKIEESGELTIARGRGRGNWHSFTFTYKTGHNVPIESDKRGHNVTLSDAEKVTFPTEKGTFDAVKGDISADKRGHNVPPSVPTKDSNNLITKELKNTGADAPNGRASPESDHQRMMKELAKQTGAISDGKAQGDAVRWLLTNGYNADESIKCLRDFLDELKDPDHWRKSRVSWLTVKKEIGSWKVRDSGERNGNEKPANTYTKPPITRDFSKYPKRA
jgi:hypothetical protein